MSGQAAFDKTVRSEALCGGETAEDGKLEREETELNGIEEERDEMSDEERVEVGEEDLAAPDWRVRAGPRNKPTQREREEHEAMHVPFRDWCAHCMMGRGRTHHHVAKQKSEGSVKKAHHRHGLLLHENRIDPECPSNHRRIDNLRCGEGRQTSKTS